LTPRRNHGRLAAKLQRPAVALLTAFGTYLATAGIGTADVPPPPPNDNYLLSTIIPQSETTGMTPQTYTDTQNTTSATVQSDLFDPEQNGLNLGGGGPEPLSCGGQSFGNTIWYDILPKIPEGVQLQVSGFPSEVVVYEWSTKDSKITRTIGCRALAPTVPNTWVLPAELAKNRAYTVQIGGLDAVPGNPATAASGQLAFSATFVPDHDGDGIYDLEDSCPTLPGVPQFGGCPPTISPGLQYHYSSSTGSGIVISQLFDVTSVPAGARVTARCSCGVSDVAGVGAHATSVNLPAFLGATLPLGSRVTFWITKGATHHGLYKYGAIGAYRQFTVSPVGLGVPVKRCLMPGSMTPRRQCPPGGRRQV
jgi:hypothetical protein